MLLLLPTLPFLTLPYVPYHWFGLVWFGLRQKQWYVLVLVVLLYANEERVSNKVFKVGKGMVKVWYALLRYIMSFNLISL